MNQDQKIIPEAELTKEAERKQDKWIAENYKRMQKTIAIICRNSGDAFTREELEGEVFVRTFATLRKKGFIDDGWETDTDVLKQCKAKAIWWHLTILKENNKHTKGHVSVQQVESADGEGDGYDVGVVEALSVNPDPQAAREDQEMWVAIYGCAESDYEKDLLLYFRGEIQAQEIAEKHGIHVNTVTRHLKGLKAKIRMKLVEEGIV